jgi:DNA polymerase III subunit delta
MISKSYILEKNINQINKNLFLFYGENLGLKNEFKNKIQFNNSKIKIIRFTEEEILKNPENFFNEIFNISLFEEQKSFFINHTSDKMLPFIKEIENKIGEQKIYLFSDILEKKSKLRGYFEKSEVCVAVACYADTEINIKKIIEEKLKDFTGLNLENINLIIDKCNNDRVKLINEIEKIYTYFSDKKIENKKLEKILDNKVNDNFNILKDSALNGNKFKTNKLLSDTFIDADKNVFYLTLINQRLNKLIEVFKLSKNNTLMEAIDKVKPPIFWKDKPNFTEQTKKWNERKIKLIMKKTYDLEIKIKSGLSFKADLLLKKLLLDICVAANS